MCNRLLPALLGLVAFSLIVCAASVRAQETQPGDACSTNGMIQNTGGPAQIPGRVLVCNGTTWRLLYEIQQTSTAAMQRLQIADDTGACAADKLGRLRYSSAGSGSIDFCNGTSWIMVGTGAGGGSYAINDLTDAIANSYNVFVGFNSGLTTATGDYNTAVGVEALKWNTTGGNNTAVGARALTNNNGGYNDAHGYNSLGNNSTGTGNAAFGYLALSGNTTGSDNAAMGANALASNAAKKESTAIGVHAMRYADSTATASVTYNTALGAYALHGSTTASANTGIRNTAIGHSALMAVTSGSNNIAIGDRAADNLTTGSGNITIGSNIDALSATGSNQLNVGNTIYGDLTNGYVGVKKTAPAAPLHVGGEAIIGPTTGIACSATVTGGLRWSSANSTFEMCDGTQWRLLAATSAASDCTPAAFSFTDVTDQPLSALIVSNSQTITGIDAGCVVSVTGGGTPQISVNGGSWVASSAINPGESLRVRLISSASVSTGLTATVTVGTTSDNWSVTTMAGQTKIFVTSSTYSGNLGGIGGAHTACQTAAAGLGYGGIWRALLSNDFINAKDLLTIAYPVVRASDGVTVDASNIWDGSLQNQITASSSAVWTGTQSDGTKHGTYFCSNWRSTSGFPGIAANKNATDQGWVYCSAADCWNASCSWSLPLYCVQQASSLGAILGISPASRATMNVFGTGSPAYGSTFTFTVENVGDTTSATMATSLSNTTNFAFVTDNCNGQTLAQGATCTVSVRAKATFPGESAGAISGTLNVTANNNPSASLSGYKASAATKIFLTPGTYNGNLGGLAGADVICQTEATALGYTGTWKALASDATTNAKDRLTIVYPVVRASDGTIVDYSNLWDGSVSSSVSTSGSKAHTGTDSAGVKSNNCSSWTTGSSGTDNATGWPTATSGWLNSEYRGCHEVWPIYCVSQ